MISYLFGGRLGDFIHGLVIPSYIYDQTGEKAHIYLSNQGDAFTAGIERTFNELIPVMAQQPYVASFEMYDGQTIDIDITRFRQCPNIETQCWTDTYFSIFIPGNRRPLFNYIWLYWPTTTTKIRRLYHRGYPIPQSDAAWNGLKSGGMALKNESISDMLCQIRNTELFIGDQSAPTAMACAMGMPRIIELNRCKAMYSGEHNYTDRMSTFHCGYVPYERTRP